MTKEGNFRRLLSVIALSCYLLSICQLPVLEGLHYLSHFFSSDHSHTTHSFYSHGEGHDHGGLDMINKADNGHPDSHNSSKNSDADKKYQIDSDEPLLINYTELVVKPNDAQIYHYDTQVKGNATPPPQV